jgi:phage terminase large subunit-like protein
MVDYDALPHPDCYYDEDAVAKAVKFFQTLVLTKATKSGRPERMKLLPPHRAIVNTLLGWKRIADDTRQYRRAYLSFARKNAKTQIAAAIADYLLISERDEPEVYFAAKDRDQASIGFKAAKDMIEQSGLDSAFEITPSRKEIRYKRNGGILKALSSEGASKHGYNPSAVIIDELHAWGTAEQELYDALTTGSVARRQPLIIIITTAGISEHSLCGQEYRHACQVRDGVIEDAAYLPVIYEIPKDADWTDEKLWPLANPTIGDIVSMQALREECKRAVNTPSAQIKFRRLHCNQWVNSEAPWLSLDVWDACVWDGNAFS